MKKIIVVLVLIASLINLIGCSQKDDLPYALPAEQFKVVYVTPDKGNEEQLHWLQEYQNEHKGRVYAIVSDKKAFYLIRFTIIIHNKTHSHRGFNMGK